MIIPEYDREYFAKRLEAHSFEPSDKIPLPYRLFVPEEGAGNQSRHPLVFVLHGAGDRGNDNFLPLRPYAAGWSSPEVQAEYPCIILIPQCPEMLQWVDAPFQDGSYPQADTPISDPLDAALALLDETVAQQPADPNRIYIMGASMGGYGTWDTITRFPDRFAAAAPICGGGDPGRAANIVDLPVWTFHGDQDDAVPVDCTREMVAAIQAAGGTEIRYTEYPDVKHESFQMAWREPELLEWMFGQRR